MKGLLSFCSILALTLVGATSVSARLVGGASDNSDNALHADLTKLQWAGLLTDNRTPLPFLDAGGVWWLNDKAIDIADHVRQARIQIGHPIEGVYTVALVSLGPKPTYGQFLRTARAMRAEKLCDVLIFEGGRPSSDGEVEISGFSIC